MSTYRNKKFRDLLYFIVQQNIPDEDGKHVETEVSNVEEENKTTPETDIKRTEQKDDTKLQQAVDDCNVEKQSLEEMKRHIDEAAKVFKTEFGEEKIPVEWSDQLKGIAKEYLKKVKESKKCTEKLANIEKELEQSKATVEEKKAALKKAVEKIAFLETASEANDKAKTALEQQIAEQKKALATKEQEHKSALDKLKSDHNATLADKDAAIDKLNTEKESMTAENKQALDELAKENKENKKTIDRINKQLVAQAESIQANDGKSKEHTALLENTNEELNKKIAELKNCNIEKKKLTLQNNEQLNQIAKLQLQNSSLQENLNKLKEELKKAGIEMNEDDTINMVNVKGHLLKAKLIHEHLQNINDFKDSNQSTIDAKVGELVTKYAELKTKSDEQKTQIDKLTTDLNTKNQSLAEQKAQLDLAKANANAITTVTTKNKAALELLQTQIDNKVAENLELTDKVSKLKIKIVELKKKLADNVKQNDSIQAVKTELADTKNRITELTTCEAEKKQLEAQVDELTTKMTQYDKLREAMSTLEKDMEVTNDQNYEEMKIKYETLLNGLQSLYKALDMPPSTNIINFLEKIKTYIQTLQTTNIEQTATITTLTNQIKKLEAQKKAQDAQIQELQTDEEKTSELATIKEQNVECTTELDKLKLQLTELQAADATKTTTITGLRKELLTLKEELKTLQNSDRPTGLGEDEEVMEKEQQIKKVESELDSRLAAWRSNADGMITKMDEILGENTTVEKGAKNSLGEDGLLLGGAGNEEKYETDDEKKMAELNNKLSLIQERISKTRAAFSDNVEKYNKLMENEKANKSEIERLKTLMAAQTSEVATMQEVINQAGSEIEQLKDANADLTSQNMDLKTQIEALNENKTSIADQQSRIDKLTAELKTQSTLTEKEKKKLEDDLNKQQQELNEAKKEYDAMEAKNKANGMANNDMNKKIAALTEKLREKKPLLLSQMSDAPIIRTPSVVQLPKINEPSEVYKILEQKSKSEYDSDYESDDDHKISTVKWDELNSEVTDLSNALTKLIKQNIAAQKEHKEIIKKKELKYDQENKQIINANTTTLTQLQATNTALQQELKKIQQHLQQCRENNTELEQKYDINLQKLLGEIEECKNTNITSLSEKDAEIRRLQEQLTRITSNMDSKDTNQAMVNSLNTALAEMKSQLDRQTQKYIGIQNHNTELKTQIADLTERVNNDDAKQNNTELNNQLNKVEEQYAANLKEIIEEHKSKNLKYENENKVLRNNMAEMKNDIIVVRKLLTECQLNNKQCQDDLKQCKDDSKDTDAKKHADLNAANMHVAAANNQAARDRAALVAYQAAQPNVVAAVDEIKRLKAQLASRKNNIQETDITYESFTKTSPQEKRLRQMRVVIDELVLFRKNNNLKSINAPHGSTIEGELLQYIINLRKDIPSTGYGTKARHTFASSPRWYKLLMLKETNISDTDFRKARIKKNDAELNSDWSKQYS